MSYAVLLVKQFSLHALRRSEAAVARCPLALIKGEGRKACVTEVSREAAGVESGMAVTLAMARCPGIVLRTPDSQANVEAQRLLLAAAFTLSPRVEATAQHLCTIDLQGAELARTQAQLHGQITVLRELGLPAQAGMASTPLLASYAAELAQPVCLVRDVVQFLSPLPLSTANPTAEQIEILHGWGVRTLGALTALRKSDVGQRLGSEGVALWERAAGETQRALRLCQPRQIFVAEWHYETPVETIEPLLFKLRRYAEIVVFELRAASFVAEALALTLLLEDETELRRKFRLPEPTADVDSWLRVLQSHLDTVRTESRVTGVRLKASPARPPAKQAGLFETGLIDAAAFWENIARVGAIVGDDRVGTPCVRDLHRPDTFTLEKPADTVPPPTPEPLHPSRGLVLRRFRPAPTINVYWRETCPVEISGALSGHIKTAIGPWLAQGDWWTTDHWAIETWQIELEHGGLYQLARTPSGWSVEGVLD